MVGRPFRWAVCGWEALLEGREWSESPQEHLLVGQEPLLEGREQSRGLPRGPEVIERPSL